MRSSDLIPNDQLRRNRVRSSDLIVCVRNVRPNRKPIATNPDRRTSEASPPVSDRKDFTNRTALIVRYCFDCGNTTLTCFTSNATLTYPSQTTVRKCHQMKLSGRWSEVHVIGCLQPVLFFRRHGHSRGRTNLSQIQLSNQIYSKASAVQVSNC